MQARFIYDDHLRYRISHNLFIEALEVGEVVYDISGGYNVYSELVKKNIAERIESLEKAKAILRKHIEESFGNLEWDTNGVGKEVEKFEKDDCCPELQELITTEIPIVRKHLERHKWFKHIPDDNLAAIDFLERYGWIMKELYCTSGCKKKDTCEHALKLKSGEIETNPDGLEEDDEEK